MALGKYIRGIDNPDTQTQARLSSWNKEKRQEEGAYSVEGVLDVEKHMESHRLMYIKVLNQLPWT